MGHLHAAFFHWRDHVPGVPVMDSLGETGGLDGRAAGGGEVALDWAATG